MKSVTPPVTSPAWRCYATGKQPSSIGTYWWRQLDRDKNEFVGANETPLTSKCYWEYLSDAGKSVAVMGVPLNTPPRNVNGWFISGGPYADEEEYTNPKSLQNTLETEFNYQLHPRTDPASVDEPENREIVEDLERMINQRFDVAQWFLNEKSLDMINISLFYINHLQHKAWRSEGVKHLWEVIDARLGELIEEDTNVLIHSDHGLHKIERVFYLNGWLLENGYLKVNDDSRPGEIDKSILDVGEDALNSLGLKPLVKSILPDSVLEQIQGRQSNRIVDSTSLEKRIDFEESSAVGLPHGVLYVLDESIQGQLCEELEAVTDDLTGLKMCHEVVPAEDVYPTPLPDDAPDLFVRYENGIEIKDVNADDERTVFGDPVKFKADNHLDGILLAAGPDIASGNDVLNDPELIDIAPSVLHLHGNPVPEDVDGRVLTELFREDGSSAPREIETMPGSEYGEQSSIRTDETKERLQDLGYLE